MKKAIAKATILGCLCIPLFVLNNKLEVEAASYSYKDDPVAGITVVLNSYYAQTDEQTAEPKEPVKDLSDSEEESEEPAPEASPYEDIAISNVSNYVNIRNTPDTEGEIVGKIYDNSAASIIETVQGEDGDWYQIQSGSVTGYMKSEFFLTGKEAEAVAKEVGTVVATVVGTPTLRLREAPSLESATLTLLAEESEYIVTSEEEDGFVKIAVDNDLEGYVSKDYIDIRVDFEKAVSIEEEAAKLAEEERLRKEAEDAIKKAEAAKAAAKASSTKKSSTSSQTTASETTAEIPAEAPPLAENSAETSATRTAVVAYAKQFIGNRYVYGGTSLTNGTDCSGFTMSVYSHFGIGIGRSSRNQANNGRTISVDSVQPGDLIFYASGGTINHVAMYIGDGQVVHASTAKTGIVISNMYYRTPYKAASFLD